MKSLYKVEVCEKDKRRLFSFTDCIEYVGKYAVNRMYKPLPPMCYYKVGESKNFVWLISLHFTKLCHDLNLYMSNIVGSKRAVRIGKKLGAKVKYEK